MLDAILSHVSDTLLHHDASSSLEPPGAHHHHTDTSFAHHNTHHHSHHHAATAFVPHHHSNNATTTAFSGLMANPPRYALISRPETHFKSPTIQFSDASNTGLYYVPWGKDHHGFQYFDHSTSPWEMLRHHEMVGDPTWYQKIQTIIKEAISNPLKNMPFFYGKHTDELVWHPKVVLAYPYTGPLNIKLENVDTGEILWNQNFQMRDTQSTYVIENQESPAEATDAQGVVHDVRFKLIEFGAEDEPQKFQLTATGQGPSESHFTIGTEQWTVEKVKVDNVGSMYDRQILATTAMSGYKNPTATELTLAGLADSFQLGINAHEPENGPSAGEPKITPQMVSA